MVIGRKLCMSDGDGNSVAQRRYLEAPPARPAGKFLRCVPLDEIDFERRDWIPLSGWPFSRRDLAPFYARANQICGIGPFMAGQLDDWGRESAASQPWQTEVFESVVSQFGKASIFKTDYPAGVDQNPQRFHFSPFQYS